MAIIKCKMCGGDIELSADKTFGVCEYCGSTMTFPRIDDEHRAAAFNRGNHFRRIGEFDKALAIYENIVRENDEDAEAHWCCALCRFGIEYVEDPASHEWLPTCHRASFDSILEDVDYQAALEHSDGVTRRQYEKDAAKIAEVQRGILATSQKEEPFDVFICYKETDDSGQRTRDSMLAQDVYYQLTEKGYRVFFARITLEDKAGSEYEPYIFAALNSAKVMICIGTKPEHFNAVWVKNEWSRYLALMRKDRKKLLLPCYRDMDPYDLPEQLSVLQSYDMSKIGFIQDLIRGVSKVVDAEKASAKPAQTVVVNQGGGSANLDALLKRGNMALEDGDWAGADKYFDRVLDSDAECAEAYLGKMLAEAKCVNLEAFVAQRSQQKKAPEEILSIELQTVHILQMARSHAIPGYLAEDDLKRLYNFDPQYKSQLKGERARRKEEEDYWKHHKQLGRALRFASWEFQEKLNGALAEVLRKLDAYVKEAEQAEQAYRTAKQGSYAVFLKETDARVESMFAEATEQRERDYANACAKQEGAQAVEEDQLAIELFKKLYGYKDSNARIEQCKATIQRRIEAQNLAKENERKEKEYQYTCKLQDEAKTENNYEWAIKRFKDLQGYKDSEQHIQQCEAAIERLQQEERRNVVAKKRKRIITAAVFAAVVVIVILLTQVVIPANHYKSAEALLAAGDYDGAIAGFEALGDYKDSPTRILATYYAQAEELKEAGELKKAAIAFGCIHDYEDAAERSHALWDQIAARKTIAAGIQHTVGLKSDGSVVAVGNNSKGQLDVSGWTDIVAVAAGSLHTIGLNPDGSVVAVGANNQGQCNVSDWNDIVAIAAGSDHTVGLKSDGTVVAVGYDNYGQCDVSDWKDIIAIAAGFFHTVGLKSDGTVVAVGADGWGQCDVSTWENVVAIEARSLHTVGLKSDGTVEAVGKNSSGQCDTSKWTNIVAVASGNDHAVGLKSDGTVVSIGYIGSGRRDVSGWTDIASITAAGGHTVGLKSDGTVVAVGDNSYGQCDVSSWSDIKLP